MQLVMRLISHRSYQITVPSDCKSVRTESVPALVHTLVQYDILLGSLRLD